MVQAPPPREEVEPAVEVLARDLHAKDIDETEDFALIEATRALAHIVDPRDLVAFEQYLSPSDLLPPEERRRDWLKRVHRGADDDGSLA